MKIYDLTERDIDFLKEILQVADQRALNSEFIDLVERISLQTTDTGRSFLIIEESELFKIEEAMEDFEYSDSYSDDIEEELKDLKERIAEQAGIF